MAGLISKRLLRGADLLCFCDLAGAGGQWSRVWVENCPEHENLPVCLTCQDASSVNLMMPLGHKLVLCLEKVRGTWGFLLHSSNEEDTFFFLF